jgi:hypothetical protein
LGLVDVLFDADLMRRRETLDGTKERGNDDEPRE